MACRCDEVEVALAGAGGRNTLFACFRCQELFYFMADAAPRPRELSLFELYEDLAHPSRRGS